MPELSQSQKEPLSITAYREQFEQGKNFFDDFKTLCEIRKAQLPEGLETLHHFKGKRARFLASQIEHLDGSLSKIRYRKALYSLGKESKILGKGLRYCKPAGIVIDCIGETLKGYENIQKESLPHKPSTYIAEATYRIGYMLADGAVSGFLVEGLVCVGGGWFVVPVYLLLHTKIKQYTITPAWEFMEETTKPILRKWIEQAGNYLWSFDAEQGGYVGQTNPSKPTINVSPDFEAVFKLRSPETVELIRQLNPIRSFSPESFESTDTLEYGFYISPDGKELNAKLQRTFNRWDSATITLEAELLDITGKNPEMSFANEIHFDIDESGTTLGAGARIVIGAGGVIGLALSGTVAFSETAITTSALLTKSGVLAELSAISTSALALPIAVSIAASLGIVALAKKIREKTKTKRLPFLYEVHDCVELARKLRKYKGKAITDAIKQDLIARVSLCDTKHHTTEEGRKVLRCMKYTLEHHTPRVCLIRWYKNHDFEFDIDQYRNDFKIQAMKVEAAIENNDITLARNEIEIFKSIFPYERAPNEYASLLNNPETLLNQAAFLLHNKGVQSAECFFSDAFAKKYYTPESELEFAQQLFSFGCYDQAIAHSNKILADLIKKRSLNHEETSLRHGAQYLLILSEISKPFEQQDDNFIRKNLDDLPEELRLAVIYELLDELDLQRLELLKQIDEISRADESDNEEKISEVQIKIDALIISSYQHALEELKKHPDESNLYLKLLEFAIQLMDWNFMRLAFELFPGMKIKLAHDTINYLGELTLKCEVNQLPEIIEYFMAFLNQTSLTPHEASSAYVLLGDLQLLCGNDAESMQAYQKGFALDKTNINLVMILASDAFNQRKLNEAERLLSSSIDELLKPTFSRSREIFGEISHEASSEASVSAEQVSQKFQRSSTVESDEDFDSDADDIENSETEAHNEALRKNDKILSDLKSLKRYIEKTRSDAEEDHVSQKYLLLSSFALPALLFAYTLRQAPTRLNFLFFSTAAMAAWMPIATTNPSSHGNALYSPAKIALRAGAIGGIAIGTAVSALAPDGDKLATGVSYGFSGGIAYSLFGGAVCVLNKWRHESYHPACPQCK